LKILYATDLHGHSKKFKAVKNILDDHDLIILGADILPKGEGVTGEYLKSFIEGRLYTFLSEITVPIILDFGNDDWFMYYNLFRDTVDMFDHVYYSHLNRINIGGYTFIGMHYVPDYPFGIKDWCRRDGQKIMDSDQFGPPYHSQDGRIERIPSLINYFMNRKTILEELTDLPHLLDKSKTIYLLHSPPIQSGLDVCYRSGPVGSYDVLSWIQHSKPWLTLHGHIHESYDITKIAINKIGDTICINPGQKGGYGYNNFVWCEFYLNDVEGTFIRKEIKE